MQNNGSAPTQAPRTVPGAASTAPAPTGPAASPAAPYANASPAPGATASPATHPGARPGATPFNPHRGGRNNHHQQHHQHHGSQHQQPQQQQQQQQFVPGPQGYSPYGFYQQYPVYGGAPPMMGYYSVPPYSPSAAIDGATQPPGSPSMVSPSRKPAAIKLLDPVTGLPINLSKTGSPRTSASPAVLAATVAPASPLVPVPSPIPVATPPVAAATPAKSSASIDIRNQLKEQIRKRLEEERAAKQAADADAQQKADVAKSAADAESKRVEDEKLAADKAAADKAAADKAAAEKAAADKVVADKAAADKVVADKVVADKAAAEKEAAEKVVADKAAADQVATDKAAADEQATAEKTAADKTAADKTAADKTAADKTAADKTDADKALEPEPHAEQASPSSIPVDDDANGRSAPASPLKSRHASEANIPAVPAIGTSLLATASRPTGEEVSAFSYPASIQPSTGKSVGGVYHYDVRFLLQFQDVVNFPPRENWAEIRSIINVEASGAGKAGGRSFSRGTSMRGSGAGQQPMGSFGSGSGFRSSDRAGSMSGQGGFGPMGHGGKLNRMPSSNNLMGSKSNRQPSNRRRGGPGDRSGSNRGHDDGPPPPPAAPLVKSANAWAPKKRDATAEEEDGRMSPEVVQRKVNALLNKMTLDNFDRISQQIVDISAQSKDENDGRTLRQIIELTFAKATDESHWSAMYARFCLLMTTSVSADIEDENVTTTKGGALFRKYMLTRCQEEFTQGWEDKMPTHADGTPDLESDDYYVAAKAKRRGLGLIRFIGELYKLNLLSEKIIHTCITRLCSPDDPSEEVIESLCQLMTTVGGQLERTTQYRDVMDVYFDRMAKLQAKESLPSRLRFMLMDLSDLRKRKWVDKKKDQGGPKTLTEIHDSARKQQAEKQAEDARSRGGNRMGGSRGGMGSMRSNNNMMAGDLSRVGMIRSQSGHQTLGPSSMLNRDLSGSNGSRKSSSSAGGQPMSKEGSRNPSQNTRANLYEHLNAEEESGDKKSDGESEAEAEAEE